jgi:hypothetical protein
LLKTKIVIDINAESCCNKDDSIEVEFFRPYTSGKTTPVRTARTQVLPSSTTMEMPMRQNLYSGTQTLRPFSLVHFLEFPMQKYSRQIPATFRPVPHPYRYFPLSIRREPALTPPSTGTHPGQMQP